MGEEIYELWKDQVKIIHVLDDIGFPTSCEDWGNYTGGLYDGVQYPNIEGIPPIIDDGNENFGDSMIHSWFNKPPDAEDYPMVYIIDHNMVVNTIQNESLSINSANYIFNDLLDAIPVDVEGCIDESACNYNAEATVDDGSCVAPQGCHNWCEGDTTTVAAFDCSGVCGGSAIEDECGTCNGDGPDEGYDCDGNCTAGVDCAGVCGGSTIEDECGTCNGIITDATQCACPEGQEKDCSGVCGGSLVDDACGVCNGDGPDEGYDCNGNCTAGLVCAGVCGGSAVEDCLEICGGSAAEDECQICNGNGCYNQDCTTYPQLYYDCNGNCDIEGDTDSDGLCDGQLAIDNNFYPEEFYIHKIYPNPFNPVLHINFNVAWPGVIQLDILNITGSHIETLYFGYLQSGSHELSWNAESMPSGMYLVSLNSGDENLIEKVVLLK